MDKVTAAVLVQSVDVPPLTPCSIGSEEEQVLPVHVTPDLQEADREAGPKTPHKESTAKKKSGKAGSKRKLFLQTPGLNSINKAKKLSSPHNTKARKSPSSTASVQVHVATTWPRETARSNFPQTERQQLQYLLEVTAKDARNSSDLVPKESLCASFTKVRRKDAGKDNSIGNRILRRNERGETALHVASIKGDLDDLVALIDAGADVNAKDHAGWSPLHEACNYGHQKIVEKLVEAGADVNDPGYEAITPLHDAVINDHTKVVQFLLHHGADPRQMTNQGYTAADLAKSSSVRESLRQFEVRLHYTATQGEERRGTEVEEEEIQNELKMNSSGFLSHDNRQSQEYSKHSEAEVSNNKEHLSPNRASKPVEPVGVLELRDQTLANGSENDVTVQSLALTDKQNFDEGVKGFDTDDQQDTPSSPNIRPLFTGAPTSDAEQTRSSLNWCSHKEMLQNSPHLEELEDTMCYQSSTGNISGRTDDSCSVLLAGKTGLVGLNRLNRCTKKHSDDVCAENVSMNETSEMHVDKDAVQSDLPVSERNKKCCTHQNSQDQENAGPVASQEQETRDVYLSEHENEDLTKMTHTDVELRNLESVTESGVAESRVTESRVAESRAGVRFVQKRKSTRSSGSSKHKCSTSSSTSDVGHESMAYETRVLKEYDEVQERGEAGVCLNHTANKTWRATVDKQRYNTASLSPVCVPGYEDFLMHTKSYSLSSLATAVQPNCSSACQDSAVSSRNNKAKEMKLRQQIEKEKLRLCLEQEIVRVFGNVARKSAGYDSPYGACAIIQAQMISNHVEALHAPSLSSSHSLRAEVEAVLSKFEKLKDEMCRRHRHEMDALLALSQLEGFGDASVVPEGTTSGTFELVPRKFREYYKKVLCFSE